MTPITEEILSNLPPLAPAFLIDSEILKDIEENYPIYINAAIIALSVALIVSAIKTTQGARKLTASETVLALQPHDFKRGTIGAVSPWVKFLYSLFFYLQFLYLLFTALFSIEFYPPILIILTATIAQYLSTYYWYKKVPYIRVTSDEINIFSKVGKNPETIKKYMIQEITVQTWTELPYVAEILLSSGEKVKIDFSSIHESERMELIQTLGQIKQ